MKNYTKENNFNPNDLMDLLEDENKQKEIYEAPVAQFCMNESYIYPKGKYKKYRTLAHRKNLINFYIEIKIKTGSNVINDLAKLTKDRFKHWDFEHIETFIYRYYLGYLKANREDALNKLNELKNDY